MSDPPEHLFGLTVADQGVLLDHHGQVADRLQQFLAPAWDLATPHPLDDRYADRPQTGPLSGADAGTIPLPRLPYRPRPTLTFNQLYWPSGAARHGEMYVLVSLLQAKTILGKAWGIDSSQFDVRDEGLWLKSQHSEMGRGLAQAVELRFGWGHTPEHSWSVDLYVLDIRAVTHELFALRLVDERYWWQYMGFGGNCVGRPATGPPEPTFPSRTRAHDDHRFWEWQALIEALLVQGAHVDRARLEYDWLDIDPAYGVVDPEAFCRPFASIGPLLDAACASCGLRLALDLDGKIYLDDIDSNPRSRRDDDDPDTGYPKERRVLGADTPWPPRAERLLIAFPRNIQGVVQRDHERYHWVLVTNDDVKPWSPDTSPTIADAECQTWSGSHATPLWGTLGVNEVLYTTFHAYFDEWPAACPANQTKVLAIAKRLWADRMGWQRVYQKGLISYANVIDQRILGYDDYLLYDFGSEGQREIELIAPPVEPSVRDAAPPPQLRTSRPRRVLTIRQRLTADHAPRYNACQCDNDASPSDEVAYVFSDPTWFRIENEYEAGGENVLLPGGKALAHPRILGPAVEGTDWTSNYGVPYGQNPQYMIYDPGRLACGFWRDHVLCRWSHQNRRWEVCQQHGLRRMAKLLGDLPAPVSPVTATTQRAELIANHDASPEGSWPEVLVHLDWIHQNVGFYTGDELLVWFDPTRTHAISGDALPEWKSGWFIDGGACPPGTFL